MVPCCDYGFSHDTDEARIVNQPLTPDEIRKRIVKVVPMRLGDILPNPRNPKSHPKQQREALRGSVRELGFGTVPIAYTSQRLGGKLAFGDGHMRGDEFADFVTDVAITDYTDEEIDKFLLYADPIAAMAEYESQRLDSLLRDVNTDDESLMKMLTDLAQQSGLYPDGAPDVQFKEYDESVADDVEMIECPHCGKDFPR